MTNKVEYLHAPPGNIDPRVPLQNLEAVRTRMEGLQRFLSETVRSNTVISSQHMSMVSGEISSALRHLIFNAAALLSTATTTTTPEPNSKLPKHPSKEELVKVKQEEETEHEQEKRNGRGERSEDDVVVVVEVNVVELLAEHTHFCEVCGKGFKRDANLRMHMRAHGNRFKSPEALSKPEKPVDVRELPTTRFSCPSEGCIRNKKHDKFWPLKSVICVRNHFKRSHCPKTYSCDRCHKKSFSMVADLKNHLKHCGESRWKCSCGTSFSRKDKLFGHIALFEGHMPAVIETSVTEVEVECQEKVEGTTAALKEELMEGSMNNDMDDVLFEGLFFNGFASTIDGCTLEDVLMGLPNRNNYNNNNNTSDCFWGSEVAML